MQLEHVRIDGIRVRTMEKGRGSPVLLVHGLGGSIDSWRYNIDALSRGARVFALDLPGFGQSDKPLIDYTVEFYRDFMIKFIGRFGLQNTSIVGSSLGGQIAAELAIARPDLVGRLVLVSPAGALPRSFRPTAALKRYVKVTSARSPKEVAQALYAVDKKPVDDAYAEQVFERMSQPGAREAFHSALKESASAPRLGSRLGRISSPTLLLWGKEDIMIPARFAWPYLRMKNSRAVLLERCGHRPHAERPEIFNALVLGFLKEEG
ncbi:MAG TPA: alpha/beta fold hydrolase [Nitrososphaera sp.]|nr:alpha/beta fold hydrolase [Nitrososphaera sp.]